MYEFDWSSIPGALPYMAQGMKISLEITVTAVLVGIVWGTLLAMMRLSSITPLSWFAAAYVNFFRAIPLVMEGQARLPNGQTPPGTGYMKGSRDRSDPSYDRPLTTEGGERW